MCRHAHPKATQSLLTAEANRSQPEPSPNQPQSHVHLGANTNVQSTRELPSYSFSALEMLSPEEFERVHPETIFFFLHLQRALARASRPNSSRVFIRKRSSSPHRQRALARHAKWCPDVLRKTLSFPLGDALGRRALSMFSFALAFRELRAACAPEMVGGDLCQEKARNCVVQK